MLKRPFSKVSKNRKESEPPPPTNLLSCRECQSNQRFPDAWLVWTYTITFPSLPHRDVVRGLSSLALCPDVHCPVAVIMEAVSED